ncbi:MAG TPA: hypothetical protein VGM39_11815 [Kofleriaceae bacterium]
MSACVYDESLGGSNLAGYESATIVVKNDDVLTIAFGNKSRMLDLVDGSSPKDFAWSAFNFPSSREAELYGDGLHIDFTDASARAMFRDVGMNVCNPATEDFRACLIFEHMTSGEEGASGTADFRLSGNMLTISYDIEIEHVTDKFGEPEQSSSAGWGVPGVTGRVTPLWELESPATGP